MLMLLDKHWGMVSGVALLDSKSTLFVTAERSKMEFNMKNTEMVKNYDPLVKITVKEINIGGRYLLAIVGLYRLAMCR